MRDTCTIWVCQDCMLHHANGECGSCHMDTEGTWDGHDREPLCLVNEPDIAMGMMWEQHGTSCGAYPDGPKWDVECECEIRDYAWQPCDGCGDPHGGRRHAMTLWFD